MNKKINKLINDTAWVLKEMQEFNYGSFKVSYEFGKLKSRILWVQETENTGNGFGRFYNWDFLEKLKETSDKHTVSYRIGQSENFELHIEIFVV